MCHVNYNVADYEVNGITQTTGNIYKLYVIGNVNEQRACNCETLDCVLYPSKGVAVHSSFTS